MEDLNKLTIEDHTSSQNHDGTWTHGISEGIDAPPVVSSTTTAYFRELETHLLRHINEAEAVLGCVAWLTNKAILDALAKKELVALVVQKEDFLRPDLRSGRNWNAQLRKRYDLLTCTWDRYFLPGLVSSLSVAGDGTMYPVRCVGNYNRDKSPAFPRMHHKFVVLCRKIGDMSAYYDLDVWDETGASRPHLEPYAVWTGSFNFTENGVRSLENAIYSTDLAIVEAYTDEWARIEALSEPLDWKTDWVAPEWRLGT